MGEWGAGVSSVEGVSVDVVVFEVGLSVQVGGIATIGGFGRRVAGVSGAYGSKTPCLASELAVSRRVGAQTVVHFGGNWRKWAVLVEVYCALGTWGAEVSRRGWDVGRIRMRCALGFACGPGFALRARATAC